VATAPITKSFWQAGGGGYGFFGSFLNAQGLNQENSNLKEENQNLLAKIVSLEQTLQEDQAIQGAIENTKADKFSLVSSQVIGLDQMGDFAMINQGSDDGIAENMPVISNTKVLFGKVSKVYKNYSQVMLISNESSVVDAQIVSQNPPDPQNPQSSVYGIVKGNENFSVYLDLVPSSAQINPGDTLATSGLEGIFPKDLLIGKILQSDKNDAKPFQTAKVQPFFDIKNIGNLFVITNYQRGK